MVDEYDEQERREIVDGWIPLRRASKAAADADGVKLFQMRGGMDLRTCKACRQHVGQVKTAAEWEAIAPDVFKLGLCEACRHSFDPVRDAKSPAVQRLEEWGVKQRARLAELDSGG